jgi:hypothetical protein
MELAVLLLLVYAVTAVASMIVTGFAHPIRGTGGLTQPPSREKPSADQPTPARSSTAPESVAKHAQKRVPAA